MKHLVLGAVFGLGMVCAILPAQSAVVINVTDTGGTLTFKTTGSLDLTGASFLGVRFESDGFISGGNNWYVASGTASSVDSYAMTTFDGPFGTNLSFFSGPTTSLGDQFFIWGNVGITEQVGVPVGYISGTIFNSNMAFAGLTIAGVGLLRGTYNYAIPNDTITLNISSVPLPGALPLLGIGFLGRRRKQKTG